MILTVDLKEPEGIVYSERMIASEIASHLSDLFKVDVSVYASINVRSNGEVARGVQERGTESA
jgi:hypothetical protein